MFFIFYKFYMIAKYTSMRVATMIAEKKNRFILSKRFERNVE